MEFDYEFAKNMALVVFPTAIGIFGSNLLINSWQTRKEKFSLRKELISEFHESYLKLNVNHHELFVNISEEYSRVPRNSKMTRESHIAIWDYPKDEQKKPINLFREGYKKMCIKNSEIRFKCLHFETLIELHFNHPEKFDKLFESITDDFELIVNELKRMVFAEELEDLIQSSQELTKHFKKSGEKMVKIENLLLSEKLRNIRER